MADSDSQTPISVVLGNSAPVETHRVESLDEAKGLGASKEDLDRISRELEEEPNTLYSRPVEVEGRCVTTFTVPAGREMAHVLNEITVSWNQFHSGGEPPLWVSSSSPALEELLATQWDIPRGDPDAPAQKSADK
jgi:hypothetical protein